MAHSAAATGRAAYPANSVAELARFFPDAMPVRFPIQLTRILVRRLIRATIRRLPSTFLPSAQRIKKLAHL